MGTLEEERPGVQPTSQPGGLSYSRRSGVSQPMCDKQMNSATELQPASLYSVRSRESDVPRLP